MNGFWNKMVSNVIEYIDKQIKEDKIPAEQMSFVLESKLNAETNSVVDKNYFVW